jgi:hypothetical protein
MDYKKITAIVIIVIGVVLSIILYTMVDYTIRYWPPSSKKGVSFIGYMAFFETIALFIALPILYIVKFKKK